MSSTKLSKTKEYFFKEFGCTNVLHIGGHLGQEAPLYKELGLSFTFVEPLHRYAAVLRRKGFKVIEAAVTNKRGRVSFNVAKVRERSSLKDAPGDVMRIVKRARVNAVMLSDIQEGFDGISIDAQGETYDILKSGDLNFKVIICEASEEPRYKGEGSRKKINALLSSKGYIAAGIFKHKTLDIYDLVYVKNPEK